MIFISAGTVEFPFPRLVSVMYENLLGKKEKVIIQSGYGADLRSHKNITVQQFISLQETITYYKKARINISAAGEGSCILLSQFSKNMFYVVPRMRKYNEHVDDQQLEIAEYFSKKKLAMVIEDTRSFSSKLVSQQRLEQANIKSDLFSNSLAMNLVKKVL